MDHDVDYYVDNPRSTVMNKLYVELSVYYESREENEISCLKVHCNYNPFPLSPLIMHIDNFDRSQEVRRVGMNYCHQISLCMVV